MTTFKQQLEKYAELAVKVGVNVQKGQELFISASIDAKELVRFIAEKAYEVGARNIHIDWQDDVLTRLKYEKAPDDVF